ncbi:HD-GYP domain-containing protein [Acetivibrio cellulolyticus]|uniref:HD-GYP domain-containing protein n=1 Tax=Acetivibrio cellulolyticus TaxID=35830 RepID=UPI0001E2F636|nr:HD domain-containing phosphohydrolase [Acetivibrio cellulolyticus]
MRLVGIKSLKPGQELARPVYTSSGKVVLNSGITLTESFITKIEQIGVQKVYIIDERFSDVEVSQPLDFTIRTSVTKVLSENYSKVHSSKGIDEYDIKDAAKKIVDYTREYRGKGISILSTDAMDEFIIEHSVNVAILTAFIGNQMSYNFGQLCDLVTGALIHDIGRENIAKEKPEHVSIGFEAARVCRGFNLHSSKVCYEHHENYDGSGYPRKIKGNDISEFSRVVRVADYYDNALHGYDNNNISIMPHQAFESILAVAGQMLDPEIVERFRDTIIFYPNGCTVLLSNGLYGVVIKQNIGSPQRPIVRVYNEGGIIGDIDLLKSLTLFIQEVMVI